MTVAILVFINVLFSFDKALVIFPMLGHINEYEYEYSISKVTSLVVDNVGSAQFWIVLYDYNMITR